MKHNAKENTSYKLIQMLTLLSVIFLFLMSAQTVVKAEDNADRFSISPANPTSNTSKNGYFTLSSQPGATVNDTVVVSNSGSNSITLVLYSVDAITSPRSGASYLNSDDPRQDVGAWIVLSNTKVHLAPNAQTSIPFTINIPKSAQNGQHLGGIAVQKEASSDNSTSATVASSGVGVNVVSRGLTPVLINVGDQLTPSLQINTVQVNQVEGKPFLGMMLQNDGYKLISPKGNVSISNVGQQIVFSNQVTLDTLIPRTSINYQIPLTTITVAGTYHVKASLDFGGSAPAVYEGDINYQPAKASATKAPAVTSKPASQTTSAAVASGNTPAENAVPAASTSQDNSGLLMGLLIGVSSALVIVTIGLGGVVIASRKRKQ